MKTKIFTLIAIFFSIAVFSQTVIPAGSISGTWTLSGSPYLIEGETTIPDGDTLTIEAGVLVEWQGSYTMFIQGQILAVGTETDSITFTAADIYAGFRSIRFIETLTTNDTSRFTYCIFRYGKVYGLNPDCAGGAIAGLFYDKFIIDHCLFDQNEATDISQDPNPAGGAIALWASSPVIRNSKFTNNVSYAGGAISCYEESHPLIENNEFVDNTAIGTEWGQGYGGAISCYINCHPIIRKNIYSKNLANNGGGAISLVESCNPMINNNLFDNNTSYGWGGAIEIQDTCSPQIINNTIVYNHAEHGGGINMWDYGHPQVWNTILWGNTADQGKQVYITDANCIIDFYWSNLQGGQGGIGGVPHIGEYENCIEADPLFLGSGDFPYQINDYSPCIGAGDPDTTGLNLAEFDLAGEIRIFNDTVDIGAYEWNLFVRTEEVSVGGIQSEVHVYPNPLTTITTIAYTLNQATTVQITIYNQHGKQLEVIQQNQPVGKQHWVWDAEGLPAGVYFCVLKTSEETRTAKMIKMK